VSDATGTLVIGAAPMNLALEAAQNGRYTFDGSAGASLNLVVSALTTTPPGTPVAYAVYKPDGAVLWTLGSSANGTWPVTQLPVAGTYALSVKPNGTVAANLSVQLVTR
jgi:hypothetical protein